MTGPAPASDVYRASPKAEAGQVRLQPPDVTLEGTGEGAEGAGAGEGHSRGKQGW